MVGDLQFYTTAVFPFDELAMTYYTNHRHIDLCMVVANVFAFVITNRRTALLS